MFLSRKAPLSHTFAHSMLTKGHPMRAEYSPCSRGKTNQYSNIFVWCCHRYSFGRKRVCDSKTPASSLAKSYVKKPNERERFVSKCSKFLLFQSDTNSQRLHCSVHFCVLRSSDRYLVKRVTSGLRRNFKFHTWYWISRPSDCIIGTLILVNSF